MADPNGRDPQTWIPRELFAAYVGPSSHDLLAYYDKALAKNNPLFMSFNLLAMLLLPAWLGLRRQWAMWGTFTGLFSSLSFVELALGAHIPAGAFVGVGVAMGGLARGLLLTSANAQYLKLKRRGLDDGAIRAALEGRASLNFPFALAAGLGSVTVIVGMAHLALLLTGRA
jgi:hypothetical protein